MFIHNIKSEVRNAQKSGALTTIKKTPRVMEIEVKGEDIYSLSIVLPQSSTPIPVVTKNGKWVPIPTHAFSAVNEWLNNWANN